jgi:hypothetical protein
LGTHDDNMADMTAKLRQQRHERHVFSKLTLPTVQRIRELDANGAVTYRQLGAEYGV